VPFRYHIGAGRTSVRGLGVFVVYVTYVPKVTYFGIYLDGLRDVTAFS